MGGGGDYAHDDGFASDHKYDILPSGADTGACAFTNPGPHQYWTGAGAGAMAGTTAGRAGLEAPEVAVESCGTLKNVQFQTKPRISLLMVVTVEVRVVQEVAETPTNHNHKDIGMGRAQHKKIIIPRQMITTQPTMKKMKTTIKIVIFTRQGIV